MGNNMDSKQENRLMSVSPATLGVLPHDVGERFKESLKQATINYDVLDKCKELIVKLVKEKKEMNKRFNDFYEAYTFLSKHEMCKSKLYVDGKLYSHTINHFERCLDIAVVKVNADTLEIDDNEIENVKTQVWLEFGRAFLDLDKSESVQFEHDMRLDCGADTFEEAIIELANLVDKYYYDNGKEKEGVKLQDIKISFSQSIAKDNKDLLLTKTDIHNQYDIHLKTISTIIKLSTGEILPNDLEYDYDWEILIEG